METTKTVNLRDVPDDLVRRAKICAALRGLSLKDFILQAIERALSEAGPELASVSMFVSSGKTPPLRLKRKGKA